VYGGYHGVSYDSEVDGFGAGAYETGRVIAMSSADAL
jgi:hypothetical protein